MPDLILKPGREKSLLRRHPWIFSGAVAEVRGAPKAGETVAVVSAGGEFLAWAAYSPLSQITARVWSWSQDEAVTPAFLRHRVERSILARQALINTTETNAIRLVHGESDGLPGLVVDRYQDTLVVQLLSAGVEYWREDLMQALQDLTGASCIFERSDVDVRQLEGLPERTGLVSGTLPERVKIFEHTLEYWVDVSRGHKTGFYLDQRQNRLRVRELARDRQVLDCFCYTGGFAVNAAGGGAQQVVAVDASAEALAAAGEHLILNHMARDRFEFIEGDVFHVLRSFRDRRRTFDLIILGPLKFAQTAAQVERVTWLQRYQPLGLQVTAAGRVLVTFSCSEESTLIFFRKL
jgi:23S rRNA (cytosine1962-C5)-methyltransferase